MPKSIYDDELKALQNLNWLPWVGKDYADLDKENKILFIGESHYLTGNAVLDKQYGEKEMTRWIVKGMGVEGKDSNSNFFANVLRLIYGQGVLKGKDNSAFWNKVAFYNFIQQPMDSKKKRPTKLDIENGQANFFDLITVLKPSVCVFLGLKADYKMNEAIKRSAFVLDKQIEWKDKIGTSYGRYGTIKTQEGDVIKLIFIRHPSSYFDPQRWHSFISKYMSSRMDWLKSLNDGNKAA